MKTTKQQKQRLEDILPQNELKEITAQVEEGDTPLWKYWEEYVGEMRYLGRSDVSIQSVKDHLQRLLRHSELTSIERVSTKSIKDYLRAEKEKKKWGAATYNTNIIKLGMYFRFLMNEEYIKVNPVQKITKIKEEKKNQRTLTKNEFKQLIGHIELSKDGLIRRRDKVFCTLLATMGIRRAEALKIKLGDIDWKQKSIKIYGVKGTKPRTIRIQKHLLSAMEGYIKYRVEKGREEKHLFISATKKGKWTASGVRKSFERYSNALGFKIGSHPFRRYAATTLAQNKVPLEEIMMYLGHTNLKTTLRYINSYTPELTDNCSSTLDKIMDNF